MKEILEDGVCLNVLIGIYLKESVGKEPCKMYSERTGTSS